MGADPCCRNRVGGQESWAAADGKKAAEPGCIHCQSFRSVCFEKGEDVVIYWRRAITPRDRKGPHQAAAQPRTPSSGLFAKGHPGTEKIYCPYRKLPEYTVIRTSFCPTGLAWVEACAASCSFPHLRRVVIP